MTTPSGVLTSGRLINIGTTALQITQDNIICAFGVVVKANRNNEGNVYVGPKGVTIGVGPATDGLELCPGEAVFIEVDNASKIYVIALAYSQQISFIAV